MKSASEKLAWPSGFSICWRRMERGQNRLAGLVIVEFDRRPHGIRREEADPRRWWQFVAILSNNFASAKSFALLHPVS
jgi:hypothetical protein